MIQTSKLLWRRLEQSSREQILSCLLDFYLIGYVSWDHFSLSVPVPCHRILYLQTGTGIPRCPRVVARSQEPHVPQFIFWQGEESLKSDGGMFSGTVHGVHKEGCHLDPEFCGGKHHTEQQLFLLCLKMKPWIYGMCLLWGCSELLVTPRKKRGEPVCSRILAIWFSNRKPKLEMPCCFLCQTRNELVCLIPGIGFYCSDASTCLRPVTLG